MVSIHRFAVSDVCQSFLSGPLYDFKKRKTPSLRTLFPAIMAPSTSYLHLLQGQGGIFCLPFEADTTKIGTGGCRMCVCVYIPISSDTCFAAHIDSHVSYASDGGEPRNVDWILKDDAEGQALKEFTKAILHDTLPEFATGEKNIERGQAIVICPCRKLFLEGVQHKATGFYVVEAINEFFKLESQVTDQVTETAHGFAVDHPSGSHQFFKFGGASEDQHYRREELNGYERLTKAEWDEYDVLRPLCREKLVKEYGFEAVKSTSKRGWTFELDEQRQWRLANFPLGEA